MFTSLVPLLLPASLLPTPVLAAGSLALPPPYAAGDDYCWEQAAARYRLHPDLLRAIAHVESRTRASAMNRSHFARTNTVDVGMMQINSSHLKTLARFGIKERDLLDACTNTVVGAWILAGEVQRRGATWQAAGAYNAACSQLKGAECAKARKLYVAKVQTAYFAITRRAAAAPVVTASTNVNQRPALSAAVYELRMIE